MYSQISDGTSLRQETDLQRQKTVADMALHFYRFVPVTKDYLSHKTIFVVPWGGLSSQVSLYVILRHPGLDIWISPVVPFEPPNIWISSCVGQGNP